MDSSTILTQWTLQQFKQNGLFNNLKWKSLPQKRLRKYLLIKSSSLIKTLKTPIIFAADDQLLFFEENKA